MAQPVSQNDVIAALNGLRGEVPGLALPALFTLRQEFSDSFKSLNDRAIEEIAAQVRALAEKVEVHQASLAQVIDTVVTNKFAQANARLTSGQARVTTLVEQLRIDVLRVAHGKLEARGGLQGSPRLV